jgi:UDP-glucose 4-epimerase
VHSQYGPEQLDFLRYRPVLLNKAIKTRFGFTPKKTSEQALAAYRDRRSIPRN